MEFRMCKEREMVPTSRGTRYGSVERDVGTEGTVEEVRRNGLLG